MKNKKIPESITYEEIFKPLLRFIAKGNTYPYREVFRSAAWHWNHKLRLWINENETSEDNYCIWVITKLPNIEVICEGPIE